MSGLREVLDRFRAAGPPGPAAPAAVPADRRSLLLDELAPVFAALGPVTAEARDLVASAAAEADRIRADADRLAGLTVLHAEAGRDAVYATAFAEARAAATGRAEHMTTEARRRADAIGRRAAARATGLAERATANACRTLIPSDRIGVP